MQLIKVAQWLIDSVYPVYSVYREQIQAGDKSVTLGLAFSFSVKSHTSQRCEGDNSGKAVTSALAGFSVSSPTRSLSVPGK